MPREDKHGTLLIEDGKLMSGRDKNCSARSEMTSKAADKEPGPFQGAFHPGQMKLPGKGGFHVAKGVKGQRPRRAHSNAAR